jgi:hypothetical protein
MQNMNMCTPAASAYLDIPQSTLEKMRMTGRGPSFVKDGRLVIYRKQDLDAWLASRLRQSTAEQNEAAEAGAAQSS